MKILNSVLEVAYARFARQRHFEKCKQRVKFKILFRNQSSKFRLHMQKFIDIIFLRQSTSIALFIVDVAHQCDGTRNDQSNKQR